jgi:hypothetical protein
MQPRIVRRVRATAIGVAFIGVVLPAVSRAEPPEASPNPPRAASEAPRVAIGPNVLQPAVYGLASTFFSDSHFIPVPLDAHVRIQGVRRLTSTEPRLAQTGRDRAAASVECC